MALIISSVASSSVALQAAESAVKKYTVRPPVSGRNVEIDTIMPADVLARSELVVRELESLRAAMGKPAETRPLMTVTNAKPREVYFQGLTLLRKANQLALEQTQTRFEDYRSFAEVAQTRYVRPYHVWWLTDSILQRILLVKAKLEVMSPLRELERPTTTTSDEAFAVLVQANRQLNLLLDRPLEASDVYQKVNEAIWYAARLLAEFPGSNRIPSHSAFEPNKMPSDVYRRLLKCFWHVGEIAKLSGTDMLALERQNQETEEISPSDVYDVAALIVSELDYLYGKLLKTDEQYKEYYPGRKYPAQVFQRVGLLEQQLMELEQYAARYPGWLKQQ